jgi:hypothetical protein
LPPRLLRDVCQSLLAWNTFDWKHTEQLTDQWSLRGIVALAVTTAFNSLDAGPLPQPLEWTRSYRPSRWERLAFDLTLWRQVAPEAATIAAILGLRRFGARASLAWSVLVPSKDYLSLRYPSHRARWCALTSSSIRLLRQVTPHSPAADTNLSENSRK